jgi:hypothetical protein
LKLKDGGEKFVLGFSEEKSKSVVIASRIKWNLADNMLQKRVAPAYRTA